MRTLSLVNSFGSNHQDGLRLLGGIEAEKKNLLWSSANNHWLSCWEERSACVCLRLML